MNGMNYLNGHYWCKRASTRSAILANRFRLWFTNRKNVYDAVQICCCAFTHFFHHIVLFFRGNFFFYLTHFLCGFRQCISFIILFIDRFPIDATLSSSIDLSFFFFLCSIPHTNDLFGCFSFIVLSLWMESGIPLLFFPRRQKPAAEIGFNHSSFYAIQLRFSC